MIRALVRLTIDNPVLLNLLFVVVVAAGALAWVRIPKEEFPQIRTDQVAIVVVWPGADPPEVEDRLVRPIEEALNGVEGIDHTYAEALEDRATVMLELARGTDAERVRDEVRRRLGSSLDLPDLAAEPYVDVVSIQAQLLHVALIGDPRRGDLVETLRAELLALPGVSDAVVDGVYTRQLRVELDLARATVAGVGPTQIASALKAAGVGVPAGTLQIEDQAVTVRTPRGVHTPADLASVPLAVIGGTHVTVGDLATVQEVWIEPAVTVRLDGQPAVDLMLRADPDADATAITPVVQAWVKARAATMPPGLELRAYDDAARYVNARLGTVASNAAMGFVIVALLLWVFIGWRNALLVVAGLPVAYGGALFLVWTTGATLNLVSLFGLLLVVGILVDDAIVVVENIQRHREMGKSTVDAAIDGTVEIVPAVTAATLTTVFSFAPLFVLDGFVGRILAIVPTVVILSLIVSLGESFFMLPAHVAHWGGASTGEEESAPTRWTRLAYTPIIDAMIATRRRWLWLLGAAAITGGLLSLAATRRVELTTPGEPVFALVDVDLPEDADARATTAVVREIEARAAAEGQEFVLFVRSHIGQQVAPPSLPTMGPRHAQVVFGFVDDDALAPKIEAWLADLRADLLARPDLDDVAITTLSGGPPVGKPVDVRVRGRDADAVIARVAEVVTHLKQRPGVSDVRTDLGLGAPAFEVRVRPEAAARWGLSEAEIAVAARAAISGADAQDVLVAGALTPTVAGLPSLRSAEALGDLPTALPDRRIVRLRQLADVTRVQGVARIGRVDGQRSIRVTASLDPEATSGSAEMLALNATMPQETGGVTLLYGGEQADTMKSFGMLPWAGALALLLNYALLAVQFRSYLQPLLVLAAVPLGLAGAVAGLVVWGMQISLIAAVGSVALIGIVVNDAIVMVDFVNLERAQGKSTAEAVRDAALLRLRPILLTTVTTVGGILPIAFGIGGVEPLLAPMAVVIGFGLLFATALTLIVVPLLYLMLDDLLATRSRPGPPHG